MAAPDAVPVGRPKPQRVMKGIDDATVLDIVREALRADRIDLYLQPIVSLPQRKRRYYECFSRIRAADDSVVMPEQYIGVAERAGLIGTIDNMLLFRCIQLVRRVQRKNQNLGFFCNISQHTLADAGFFRDFLAFMTDNADLAPNLAFEFAQSNVENLGETSAMNLERLANVGFGFSVDQVRSLDLDFASLADRHFNFVKIDVARLVEQAKEDGGEERVQSLKSALDRDGIDLIVEKIEEEKTLVELLDYQIDFGQGYLFGEPRVSKE